MKSIKQILPSNIYQYILSIYDKYSNPFYQKSYAQEGEDIVLQRFLAEVKKGFYVDVGAHHPKRFSNTYTYYKKGWRGINIEPRPGSKTLFDKIRPRDINLELPVNSVEEELTYYIFNEPALNGFSKEDSQMRDGVGEYKIIDKIKIKTRTLKNILDQYLSEGQHIDFLSVDVEGLDMEVLRSNDWSKYKPDIILVEDKNFDFTEPMKSMVFSFLIIQGYTVVAKTFNTLVFKIKTRE